MATPKRRLEQLERSIQPSPPVIKTTISDEQHTRGMATLCEALETLTGEHVEINELNEILKAR
jgi:chemotaxis protein CheY-P-specific phosphatase CheC